jgi:hypothetical protein
MSSGAILTPLMTAPRHRTVVLFSILAFTVSLASAIAWKVSDVDFATRIGSGKLGEAYICTALALFLASSFVMVRLKWFTPQSIFLTVQRYATAAFGLLAICELAFGLSQWTTMIFIFKVIGYVYSSLILNSYWLALNPFDSQSQVTAGEFTLYTFCTYLGMAMAGVMLQSTTMGAGQLGLTVTCCSIICWLVGSLAFEDRPAFLRRPLSHIQSVPRPSPVQTLCKAMVASRAVFTLIVGSVLLSVLVTSTEYSIIADFESRYLTLAEAPNGVKSIGSFVTLIGFGNILTLCTSRLWSRFQIGRTALPIATILAVLMIRLGFMECPSLISSVLALLVVESLYPLVVESNMQYLLAHFPESDRVSARTMIDAIAEPAGLLLSAVFLFTPWFDIHTLGIGVVCVSFMLLLYSWSVDRVWRKAQVASFRQMMTLVSTRASAILVLLQTFMPCVDSSYDFADDLVVVEGYNWLHIPAVQWCD